MGVKRAIVALVALLSLAVVISGTCFVGSASSGVNKKGPKINIGLSPASELVTCSNMAPGDSVSGDLTVSNVGVWELRYAMTTTVVSDTGALALQLRCTITDSLGTVLYSGSLSGAYIGDPTPGYQLGDRVLASRASEVLTFTVELPIDTGNAYQGQSCDVNFNFFAEQTKKTKKNP